MWQKVSRLAVAAVLPLVLIYGMLAGAAAAPVASPALAAHAATLNVAPNPALAGQVVGITGTGFAANERVNITGTGLKPIAVTAAADGTLYGWLMVPCGQSAGQLALTATGNHGSSAQSAVKVTRPAAAPWIAVGPQPVRPGLTAYVTGCGFPAKTAAAIQATIQMRSGGAQRIMKQATADAGGTLGPVALAIPAAAKDGVADAITVDTLSVHAIHHTALNVMALKPALTVSPAASAPGSRVAVSGQGFAARVAVSVAVNGHKVATATTTDTGTFSVAITAGAKAGSEAITATSAAGRQASATLRVTGRVSRAASLTLSPTTLIPGQAVKVTGAGFAAGSAVTITMHVTLLNGKTDTRSITVRADASGHIATTLTVPAQQKSGRVETITAIAAGKTVATATLHISALHPALTIAPNPAQAGHTVTVHGSGYAAHVAVTIDLNGHTVGHATTNGSGAFSTTLTVPAGTTASALTVTARSAAGRQAKATLSVQPAQTQAAALAISPHTPRPGATLTVSGSHFAPNTTVTIHVGFTLRNGNVHPVDVQAHTNASGALVPVTITIPAAAKGGSTATVAALSNGKTLASATLTIKAIHPAITVSPKTARSGDHVMVTGSDFAANVAVAVLIGGHQVATAHTDAHGAFSVAFTVPAGMSTGSVTIKAQSASGRIATVSLQVQGAAATLSVAGLPARPGTSIKVTGDHFPANTTVTITTNIRLRNGDVRPLSAQAHTDGAGHFGPVSLTIPADAKSGATDHLSVLLSGRTLATTALTIMVLHPSLSLAPSSPQPGTHVAVTGYDFAAGVSVAVYYGSTRVATAHTNGNGVFTTMFTVPSSAGAGRITVKAVSDTGRVAVAALLISAQPPAIAVAPQPVIPGGTTNVSGSRFRPGEAITVTASITLRNGDLHPVSIQTHADANGHFGPLTLHIPAEAASNHWNRVSALVSGHAVVTAKLLTSKLSPSIVVTPAAAQPGKVVTVTGTGFAANIKVNVFLAGHQVATATTNGSGTFVARFTVPSGLGTGRVTVKVESAAGRVAQSAFTALAAPPKYAPQISVYPKTTIPGAQVFVTGAGFPANQTVTITATFKLTNGKLQTVVAKANTGAKGIFLRAPLNVPQSAAGAVDQITAAVSPSILGTASLTIQPLKPTIVLSPSTATPGTKIVVQGFGFAANTTVTVTFNGTRVASAHASAGGRFTTSFVAQQGLASGGYAISATSSAGRTAQATLHIQRQIVTTYYFAEGNTSYAYGVYLDLLNPGNINGRVNVIYYNNQGQTIVKTYTLPAHTRQTIDVRSQVGANRGVAMKVTADVPIAATRVIYHGVDAASSPGATGLHRNWYFAEGNTLHGYSEWLPLLNPGNQSSQVHVTFLTTHHGNRSISFTLGAHSRISLHVNQYVAPDAVGVILNSQQPIVAERTVYYNNGHSITMTNKVGKNGYFKNWYFPAGRTFGGSVEWISADNPNGQPAHVTMYTYNQSGDLLATTHRTIKPYHRIGYKMNSIAPNADISVTFQSDVPVLAERLLYFPGGHNALTDDFGVTQPGTAWWFANGDTRTAGGYHDTLSVFNPNLGPAPVIVRVMTSGGKVINAPFLIPPTTKEHIDLNSLAPNTQFGAVVNASVPVTVEQLIIFNKGQGGMTTHGIPGF